MDSQASAAASALYQALVSELGPENVSRDANIAQRHAGDWSEAAKESPLLVIFPRSPSQVAMALAILSRFGQKAVIQGGLTGLAGGATPHCGEVALSLAKLNEIEEFDRVGGTVTVQAGVTLEQMQTC